MFGAASQNCAVDSSKYASSMLVTPLLAKDLDLLFSLLDTECKGNALGLYQPASPGLLPGERKLYLNHKGRDSRGEHGHVLPRLCKAEDGFCPCV